MQRTKIETPAQHFSSHILNILKMNFKTCIWSSDSLVQLVQTFVWSNEESCGSTVTAFSSLCTSNLANIIRMREQT
jgi:hypothetical protein